MASLAFRLAVGEVCLQNKLQVETSPEGKMVLSCQPKLAYLFASLLYPSRPSLHIDPRIRNRSVAHQNLPSQHLLFQHARRSSPQTSHRTLRADDITFLPLNTLQVGSSAAIRSVSLKEKWLVQMPICQ